MSYTSDLEIDASHLKAEIKMLREIITESEVLLESGLQNAIKVVVLEERVKELEDRLAMIGQIESHKPVPEYLDAVEIYYKSKNRQPLHKAHSTTT